MKEYKIIDVEKSDFVDQFNNSWLTIAVEGLNEPVKLVVKDPNSVSVGDKLYGEIVEQESKSGNKYLRFKKAQRPEPGSGGYQESPEKQESITRAVSLNNAVLYWQGIDDKDPTDVLGTAKVFYAYLKGQDTTQADTPAPTPSTPVSGPQQHFPSTADKEQSPRDWSKVGKSKVVTANSPDDEPLPPEPDEYEEVM